MIGLGQRQRRQWTVVPHNPFADNMTRVKRLEVWRLRDQPTAGGFSSRRLTFRDYDL